jgi:hypothetical protein
MKFAAIIEPEAEPKRVVVPVGEAWRARVLLLAHPLRATTSHLSKALASFSTPLLLHHLLMQLSPSFNRDQHRCSGLSIFFSGDRVRCPCAHLCRSQHVDTDLSDTRRNCKHLHSSITMPNVQAPRSSAQIIRYGLTFLQT